MAEITKVDGRYIVDYMARDYDSFLQSMRDLIPGKLPEWKDFESEADFGNVLLQLFAHMGDILSYYQDRIANESFLGTAQDRRSIIHHLRLIGYKLSTAAPASATLTLTVPATCEETVTISQGDAFATKSQKDQSSVRFEYTGEHDLDINCSELPPNPNDPSKKYYEGIPVEEGRFIKDELLGISDGTPNQTFLLAHPGIILRSLGMGHTIHRDIILVSEGSTIEEWTLQESLAFSREEQKDFVIEIDEEDRATVIFGDGAFGAIPASGAVIKASYRMGGGSHGNVAPDTIQTIVDAPQLALIGATITNPQSATGGAERESTEHAVQHAPGVFRSLKRAVTAEDYKALALDFKGVGKVRAEATSWNAVKLLVAPEGSGYVSDVLRANLLAYFEDKRPITTKIEIQDVHYVKIYITAQIGVSRYYSREAIKEKVRETAGKLLDFDNVDFGQIIYLSKFYEAIEAIDGVEYVNISEFTKKPKPPYEGEDEDNDTPDVEPSGKIEVEPNEIPCPPDDPAYAGGIKVIIVEGGII